VELPKTLEEAIPSIVPRIRDRFFYEAVGLQCRLKGEKPIPSATLPFADHYAIELGYDLPDSIMSLTPDQFEAWGTSFDALLGGAIDKLRSRTQQKLKTLRHGLYQSDWNDDYDACRILLKDFILGHEVQGEPVVAIPNRNTLILTGSRDEAGLKALAERSGKALQAPRPMFGLPLVLSEGQYLPVSPEHGSPAYRELKNLCLGCLGQNYGEQKDLLEKLHEKDGQDLFVASYSSIERKENGLLRSWCSWAKGVDSLLPKTDLIVLGNPRTGTTEKKAEMIMVDWQKVADTTGDLLKPEGFYPPRFRVNAFPNEDQLIELRRCSIRV